ncbi:MAG TPA: hypothetical protein VF484_01645 [Candidatus Limnocylindrales bacterium]
MGDEVVDPPSERLIPRLARRFEATPIAVRVLVLGVAGFATGWGLAHRLFPTAGWKYALGEWFALLYVAVSLPFTAISLLSALLGRRHLLRYDGEQFAAGAGLVVGLLLGG